MFYSKDEIDQLISEHSKIYSEWENKKFVMVPQHIVFSENVTTGELVFYLKILSFCNNNDGYIFHSNEKLAELLNCTVSNVKKYLDALKKRELINVYSSGTHNKRYVCFTPWKEPKQHKKG